MLRPGHRRRRFLQIGRAVEWLSFVLALSVIVLIVIAMLTWWAPYISDPQKLAMRGLAGQQHARRKKRRGQ